MTGHRKPLLSFFALLVAGAGCDCGDDSETTADPGPETPRLPDPSTIEVPEGLTLQICAAASRARLYDTLGLAAAEILPDPDARNLVESIQPEAPLEQVTAENAYCTFSLDDQEQNALVAVRLVGPPPQGGPDGPAGGVWLGEAAAVIGEALVVGRTRAMVESAGAYAALVALPTTADAPALQLHAPEGVVADRLQPMARPWLENADARGRANIEREMASHEGPAELGDPLAVFELFLDIAGIGVQALGDLGAVYASMEAEDDTVSARIVVQIREGSDFADRVASWPTANADFGALPEGTALAYFRAGLAEGELSLAEVLERFGGERMGVAERDALRAVSASARARPRTLLLGGTAQGPFALWRAHDADLGEVAGPLRAAFARGYLATLASAASGCNGAGARLAGRASGRCPEAPVSTIRDSTFVVAAEGQRVLLDDGPREPALARFAPEEPVVAALGIVPSSLPAAARLVAELPPLGAISPSGGAVLSVRRRSGELVVELRSAPEALATLTTLLGS